MPRYIISRVLYTLPVIWLVVSTVFLLIHFVPGDPIQQMLGEGAAAGDIQAARHAYGLDVPLGEQYLNYWKGRAPRRSGQVPPLQPGSNPL
jgi:ABC-type dipeptide/oligopeptide/nickel transport system permease component